MPFEHSNPFAGPSPAAEPAGAPLQYLDGQPVSHDQVTARMETLKTDAAFMKRVEARDAEAFSEYNKLWRLSRGLAAVPEAPVNAVDVIKEAIGSDLAIAHVRAESLRDLGFTETQIYEHLNGRPIPFEERRAHERRLGELQRDKRLPDYLAGRADPEYAHEMRRVHIGLSMRVGTQDQIAEWERLYAERKPK